MMTRKLLVISGVLLLACVLVPVTPAQENLNGELTLTVNTPMSVPGGVLAPGKYHLRFIDPYFSIVALTREDGTAVGQYQVRPSKLPEAPSKTEVMVGWLPDGSPAISQFFYPGEPSGFRFEYPGAQPVLLANKPAPATTVAAAQTGEAPASAPAANEAPANGETAESNPPEATPEPPPMIAQAPEAQSPELPQKSPELPQTASPLPLLGLLGMGSVVAGIVGRRRGCVEKL